jgi:hypothetical protein
MSFTRCFAIASSVSEPTVYSEEPRIRDLRLIKVWDWPKEVTERRCAILLPACKKSVTANRR